MYFKKSCAFGAKLQQSNHNGRRSKVVYATDDCRIPETISRFDQEYSYDGFHIMDNLIFPIK